MPERGRKRRTPEDCNDGDEPLSKGRLNVALLLPTRIVDSQTLFMVFEP